MTAFAKNTLADQIERGEVFYGGYVATSFGPSDVFTLVIETDTSDCYLNLDIATPITFLAVMSEGTANTHSGSITLFNMRRSDTTTTIGATAWGGGTITGGSVIANVVADSGKVPTTNPLNRENGIALKASSAYTIVLQHYGDADAYLNIGLFLREIK